MSAIACPKCASDDITGIEVRGVYDGVLFWVCSDCAHAWPREFFDPMTRRATIAREYADAHNIVWSEREATP